MNKSEDTIKEGLDLWSGTRSEEVIQKVFEIKKKIEDKPVNEWSIDGLVDHIFTLCKIMDNLSDLKDYARLKADAYNEEYESTVRDTYLSLKESGVKMTDAMCKAKAEQKNDELRRKEIASEYQSRLLNDLYKDCDRLINFTQTKIKSLVDEKIRTKIPNI